MKVIIHPAYHHIENWIKQIPLRFHTQGDIVYQARNVIKSFVHPSGIIINVKRYRKPHLLNRWVYTFLRKTKAARAYDNTIKIAEKGFNTAAPVAYIEIRESGLFADSYFVSLHCPRVREIRICNTSTTDGNEALLDAFTRYTASLHEAGIYHLDYSPGNILFREENGQYTFILIDVNRMKFMPVSYAAGCRNFARLFVDDAPCRRIGTTYAHSRENTFGEEATIRYILHYKQQFWKKQRRKARLKALLRKALCIHRPVKSR